MKYLKKNLFLNKVESWRSIVLNINSFTVFCENFKLVNIWQNHSKTERSGGAYVLIFKNIGFNALIKSRVFFAWFYLFFSKTEKGSAPAFLWLLWHWLRKCVWFIENCTLSLINNKLDLCRGAWIGKLAIFVDEWRSNEIKRRKICDEKIAMENIKNKGSHFSGPESHAPLEHFGVPRPRPRVPLQWSQVPL